jgi:CheY-like chemotaxis protein
VLRLPILDFGFSILDCPDPVQDGAVVDIDENPKSKIQNPKSKRVLVVDDNVDAAATLAELVDLWGHEVRVAYDGRLALEEVSRFQPEVVLLDIGLPQMDGYEVARRLGEQAGRQGLRLVAVTGYGQEEDRRKAEAAGFDDHLVKPVDPDALQQLLAATPRRA